MPRGDGKKSGEPRTHVQRSTEQYIPWSLARRQKAFDEQKNTDGDHRPGSQKGK